MSNKRGLDDDGDVNLSLDDIARKRRNSSNGQREDYNKRSRVYQKPKRTKWDRFDKDDDDDDSGDDEIDYLCKKYVSDSSGEDEPVDIQRNRDDLEEVILETPRRKKLFATSPAPPNRDFNENNSKTGSVSEYSNNNNNKRRNNNNVSRIQSPNMQRRNFQWRQEKHNYPRPSAFGNNVSNNNQNNNHARSNFTIDRNPTTNHNNNNKNSNFNGVSMNRNDADESSDDEPVDITAPRVMGRPVNGTTLQFMQPNIMQTHYPQQYLPPSSSSTTSSLSFNYERSLGNSNETGSTSPFSGPFYKENGFPNGTATTSTSTTPLIFPNMLPNEVQQISRNNNSPVENIVVSRNPFLKSGIIPRNSSKLPPRLQSHMNIVDAKTSTLGTNQLFSNQPTVNGKQSSFTNPFLNVQKTENHQQLDLIGEQQLIEIQRKQLDAQIEKQRLELLQKQRELALLQQQQQQLAQIQQQKFDKIPEQEKQKTDNPFLVGRKRKCPSPLNLENNENEVHIINDLEKSEKMSLYIQRNKKPFFGRPGSQNPFINGPPIEEIKPERKKITFADEDTNVVEVVLSDDDDTQKYCTDTITSFDSSNVSLENTLSLSLSEIIAAKTGNVTPNSSFTSSRRDSTEGCPPELRNPKMRKYWNKRYQLFSKYDEGIKLDFESWYSVTPEVIASQIARKMCKRPGVIVDAFCGCGGNAIQFARRMKKVIAIDIDPVKIEYAKNNARIYGVENKIEFIVGDFMELGPTLTADVVFLSPPWGGVDYLRALSFDLRTMIPLDGFRVFDVAKLISTNIGYFVPRTTNELQLQELAGDGKVEIEQNMLDGRVVTITAYYGELVSDA